MLPEMIQIDDEEIELKIEAEEEVGQFYYRVAGENNHWHPSAPHKIYYFYPGDSQVISLALPYMIWIG